MPLVINPKWACTRCRDQSIPCYVKQGRGCEACRVAGVACQWVVNGPSDTEPSGDEMASAKKKKKNQKNKKKKRNNNKNNKSNDNNKPEPPQEDEENPDEEAPVDSGGLGALSKGDQERLAAKMRKCFHDGGTFFESRLRNGLPKILWEAVAVWIPHIFAKAPKPFVTSEGSPKLSGGYSIVPNLALLAAGLDANGFPSCDESGRAVEDFGVVEVAASSKRPADVSGDVPVSKRAKSSLSQDVIPAPPTQQWGMSRFWSKFGLGH